MIMEYTHDDDDDDDVPLRIKLLPMHGRVHGSLITSRSYCALMTAAVPL